MVRRQDAAKDSEILGTWAERGNFPDAKKGIFLMSKGNFPDATHRQRRNSKWFANPSFILFLTCWAIEIGRNISHEALSCALFPSPNEPGWTHGTEVGTFKECHPGGPVSILPSWTGNSFDHGGFVQISQSSGAVLILLRIDKRRYSHHSHWIC